MDCILNKLLIPKENDKIIILKPSSKTFIDGVASSYETTYSEKLRKYISENEFEYIINNINEELILMWPCLFCFSFGYVMCPFTAGKF